MFLPVLAWLLKHHARFWHFGMIEPTQAVFPTCSRMQSTSGIDEFLLDCKLVLCFKLMQAELCTSSWMFTSFSCGCQPNVWMGYWMLTPCTCLHLITRLSLLKSHPGEGTICCVYNLLVYIQVMMVNAPTLLRKKDFKEHLNQWHRDTIKQVSLMTLGNSINIFVGLHSDHLVFVLHIICTTRKRASLLDSIHK